MIDQLPEDHDSSVPPNSANQRNQANQSNTQNKPKKKVIDAREGLRVAVDTLVTSHEFVNNVSTAFSNSKNSR